MNQEQFEHDLMGYLFDELDDEQRAAVERKLESDAQAAALEENLRQTLDIGELPLEEPSADLTGRILAATRVARGGDPWYRRLLQGMTWAGSHAMRPQFAMAALLVLVLGSSLLLMRADPGSQMAIVPETPQPKTPEEDQPATSKPIAPPSPKAATGTQDLDSDETDVAYKAALRHYREGKHEQAQTALEPIAQMNHHRAPSAALYLARSIRASGGCPKALRPFEALRKAHPKSAEAEDGTWELADCHRALGQMVQARTLWAELGNSKRYEERARRAMAQSRDAGLPGNRPLMASRKGRPKVAAKVASKKAGGKKASAAKRKPPAPAKSKERADPAKPAATK